MLEVSPINPNVKTDHFFHSKDMLVKKTFIPKYSFLDKISDHYPIIVNFEYIKK